jgi:hypothetical protein
VPPYSVTTGWQADREGRGLAQRGRRPRRPQCFHGIGLWRTRALQAACVPEPGITESPGQCGRGRRWQRLKQGDRAQRIRREGAPCCDCLGEEPVDRCCSIVRPAFQHFLFCHIQLLVCLRVLEPDGQDPEGLRAHDSVRVVGGGWGVRERPDPRDVSASAPGAAAGGHGPRAPAERASPFRRRGSDRGRARGLGVGRIERGRLLKSSAGRACTGATGRASSSNAAWGGPRAGESRGGVFGSSRWRRMAPTAPDR